MNEPGAAAALTAGADEMRAHQRGKLMREASKWIGALSLLFLVSGGIMFFIQSGESAKALGNLSQFDADQELDPIDGKTYTAGQLRAMVEREPYQVLGVNVLVAALMGVLWFWARRAPPGNASPGPADQGAAAVSAGRRREYDQ